MTAMATQASSRRGMTLVEVLLAVAILSAMAAAVVPLLRGALRSMDAAEDDGMAAADLVFELSTRADAILGGLDAVGLERAAAGERVEVRWPDPHTDREPVVVVRLDRSVPEQGGEQGLRGSRGRAANEERQVGRGWWTFEWRGVAVSRWIEAEEKDGRNAGAGKAGEGSAGP